MPERAIKPTAGVYADPIEDVRHAEREAKVIELRVGGMQVSEIIKHEDVAPISATQVYRIIREYADRIKANTAELGNQRFAEQDARLEHLYRQVQLRLDNMVVFDEKVIRSAIMILDRQAKLWGMDRSKSVGGKGEGYKWLEEASPAELKRMADQMGLHVPEPFDGKQS